jgi:hypothetical protein
LHISEKYISNYIQKKHILQIIFMEARAPLRAPRRGLCGMTPPCAGLNMSLFY